jgi:hypothetical protein
VVVEGDKDKPAEQKPKSDSLFACLRLKENRGEASDTGIKVMSEEEEEDLAYQEMYDLNPWTDEELARDPIKNYTFIGEKKQSKI